jgi:hypothetical protein
MHRNRLRTAPNWHRRNASGQEIFDLSFALLLIIFVFFFPLLNFATIGLRYSFVMNAASLAARAAAQCKTFQQNSSTSDLSAVNTASNVVSQAVAAWSGIAVPSNGVTTSIVTIPLAGGDISRQSTPLNQPANLSNNSYDVEVQIQAQLQPLITIPGSILNFGNIPGLTAPISIATRSDVAFESVQGLNQ